MELLDAWKEEDCSDFVKEIVLPPLWGGSYALSIVEARMSLLRFLTSFKKEVEIVTDAPQYDWELFCDLVYEGGRWPRIVRNFPTDAITLEAISLGAPLPHHALMDARIIAKMFTS